MKPTADELEEMATTKTVSIEVPSCLYEWLEIADLLLPESTLMFYAAGICWSLSLNEKLKDQLRKKDLNLDTIFDIARKEGMEAAARAKKIRDADA